MAIIKCKMCGGDVELAPDKTFGTCDYCGSTMTFPKVDDDQRAAAFNRGNHFRRIGEFDKALAVYERIVTEDDSDAEAHWCCALCRFGIEYVEDPATYEYIPTCHRASFDSILEDVDYLAALEHSDGITRRQYQRDAAKIAEVQRGVLATSQNEKPYDVFICYKETDDTTKERTRDSIDAQEIYYQLTEKGYRVFFSRITLEDKGGAEYEPYIFAALNSAKVMIAVGSKPEYFNAVWVKNEWSRFIALMRKDRSKLLLPCYKDMDPYDLPEQLSVLQSYDMTKIGFMQDLIRGVEKVLQKDKSTVPVSPQVVVQQQPSGSTIIAQLKRGYMSLEDQEWNNADGFFEEVLNQNAECAEAYLGKWLAKIQKRSLSEATVYYKRKYEKDSANIREACPEDTAHIEEVVNTYMIDGYLYAAVIRKKYEFNRGYSSNLSHRKDQKHLLLSQLQSEKLLTRAKQYAAGATKKEIEQFLSELNRHYDDRIQQAKQEDSRKIEEIKKEYAAHIVAMDKQVQLMHARARERQEEVYQKALELKKTANDIESYTRAKQTFSTLNGYKDSEELANKCQQNIARLNYEIREAEKREAERKRKEVEQRAKRNSRIIIGIIVLIVLLGAASAAYQYIISPMLQYQKAEELFEKGDYEGAIETFSALGDYKNSAVRMLDANNRITELENEAVYRIAESLETEGSYLAAAQKFATIKDYKDAEDRSKELLKSIPPHHSIDTGSTTTVALTDAGTVVFTGGQSYNGIAHEWTDIVDISAGDNHLVGLRADGTVVAAGEDSYNKCDVADWMDIIQVAAGYEHTVGLKSDGTVVATGNNNDGECNVESWANIIAVSAGMNYTVGLRLDGTVVATGRNDEGQCEVTGWNDIIAISAGDRHVLGLKADGTVVSTGLNSFEQCETSEWDNIIAISAGTNHSVGLKLDGTVVAAGKTIDTRCDVLTWTDIAEVSAGSTHTVGVRKDGTVIAVGVNSDGRCNVGQWESVKVP